VAEAEGAVPRLRRFVLDLAVRGKLVAQDPADEPASELLERIRADVADYVRTTGVRSAKADTISTQEHPFSLPSGWVWTRLAALCRVVTDGDHQPPPRAEKGVAFLTIGNVTTGTLDFAGCRRVPPEYFDGLPSYRKPVRGDLLYTVVGATFGRPVLVDSKEPFCVQRHIAILKPSGEAVVPYLHHVLVSPFVYHQAAAATTGTAQPTIALKPLRDSLIPLPPLAEQHRIGAKVDGLMALCDRLETALTTADTTRARLLDALLHEALTPRGPCRSEVFQQAPPASAASALEAADSPAITL
jgi:type I restriction enzyme S subunit